jgi:predicted TIM-barrel fold metal-dependent hydrolase
MMSQLRERLSMALQSIALMDTHEHFVQEADRLKHGCDFFSYLHYVHCDLMSGGLALEKVSLEASALSSAQKKEAFFRHWPNVRFTGYGQALRIMAEDLFEVAEITPDTLAELNANAAALPRPGYYDTVLREGAKIVRACRIVWPHSSTMCDLDHLFPVPVFDHFATVASRGDLTLLEADTDVSIHNLHDLEAALDVAFAQRAEEGMVGVKNFLAYRRPISFEQVPAARAEEVLLRTTQAHADTPVGFEEARPLQDYMVHAIIRRAVERDLPIQIHTGFQNDNANFVDNTRPTRLVNLFMTYDAAKFVLLHGGWPYTQEFVALAKSFPNVYADMAWTYILGAGAAERLLGDLLDSVPANKILGFGGDYNFAEGAYAHAKLARRSIGRVLAGRIENETMSEDEALEVARMIMHDNGARLYGFAEFDSP